eukprot:TRINITY_DN41359_c0_g1_i1.p1 TRINITY_DN41359_c0_g1~~TRINITY_DN41359_c0_g1_i1.p1  ORF type:complete len:111 (+),score=43.85 TRINITY_DN41359_c0_g1_i1:44-334(+)
MLRSLVGSEMCIRDRAAIQMGYEVVDQLAAQRLYVEVAELQEMIWLLEHPLQGNLTQPELERVILDAQNPVSYTHLTLPTKRIVSNSVVALFNIKT